MKQFFSSLFVLVAIFFGLIQAAALPSPPNSIMTLAERDNFLAERATITRLINVSGEMRIRDDEVIRDRFFTRTTTFPGFHVSTLVPTERRTWVVKVGGEIRVEVEITFNLRPADQSVKVDYNVKLFEGVTEKTNDLDGARTGSAVVLKNVNRAISFKVKNTAESSDDYADIVLHVFNGDA